MPVNILSYGKGSSKSENNGSWAESCLNDTAGYNEGTQKQNVLLPNTVCNCPQRLSVNPNHEGNGPTVGVW